MFPSPLNQSTNQLISLPTNQPPPPPSTPHPPAQLCQQLGEATASSEGFVELVSVIHEQQPRSPNECAGHRQLQLHRPGKADPRPITHNGAIAILGARSKSGLTSACVQQDKTSTDSFTL